MPSLLSPRRLAALLCAVIIAGHKKCSAFPLPVMVSSSFGPQRQKAVFQRRMSCSSFPKESIEVAPPSISEASAPGSPKTASDTQPKCTYSFIDRVHQLQDYKDSHGDLLVPKRYPENPSLGNWVNKQRAQYRKFLANETPCSMTEQKVEILNQIGFCWDGSVPKSRKRVNQDKEEKWWSRLEELRAVQESGEKKLSPTINRWLKQQRIEYEKGTTGPSSLDKKKLEALYAIDPDWWKSFRQRQWDQRYQELIAYKEEYGDCCVPISYAKNKKLANWVSTCRKQYKLFKDGESSHMSQDRIDKLNAIGFVWNRWEYEFGQMDFF